MKSFFIIGSLCLMMALTSCQDEPRPRVFVFTDINIDSGDPDDRQSLVHLFWYADELDIAGVVPDRWNARGMEACQLVAGAYESDFTEYRFSRKGYPEPAYIRSLFATDREDAVSRFAAAAADTNDPLYVLVWGNMRNVGEALRGHPELAANIRLITIGTGLMLEKHNADIPEGWPLAGRPCEQYNWNGAGRQQIYEDRRFADMWWLEINWTYEGMFTGDEPTEMFDKLSVYGALGQHLQDVTINEPWAQYFRVGDTPSVLYVIDPNHDPGDPTQSSWAGRFVRPMPDERPNYYTDHHGSVEWDYADPCNTWHNHVDMHRHARSTLESERPGMYKALLEKLDGLYGKPDRSNPS